jgi:hypothetical protein
MKIKAIHYSIFRDKLYPFLNNHPELTKENLLSSMRLRWDTIWDCKILHGDIVNEIYGYLNDDNIDTAVKSLIREYKPIEYKTLSQSIN